MIPCPVFPICTKIANILLSVEYVYNLNGQSTPWSAKSTLFAIHSCKMALMLSGLQNFEHPAHQCPKIHHQCQKFHFVHQQCAQTTCRQKHIISETIPAARTIASFLHAHQTFRIQHGRHEFHEEEVGRGPQAPKEKKEKKVKAPKEKKEKAPKDPNAPKKTFLGREKKTPRSELQAEIDRLNQEVASKDQDLASKDQELADKTSELDAMKKWASSSPVAR